jgi:hypothetical protein
MRNEESGIRNEERKAEAGDIKDQKGQGRDGKKVEE